MSARERLRVALVSVSFGEYCMRLANALSPYAEVLLLMPERVVRPYAAKLDGRVRLFSYPSPRLRQPLRQLRTMRTVMREIRAFSPDVIHYQGFHLWFDLALAVWRQYPLVFTVHDFRAHPGDKLTEKTPFWLEMLARRSADQIIVHSRHVEALLGEELGGRRRNIHRTPHIQIGSDPVSAQFEEDENLILFFGRIWEYKGLEYLIRAEPLISARVPEARILIAGQGEDFERYRRMMKNPERFLVDNEYISRERAQEYFERASVVVLPYIEASQSGVIPLAYSAGKPVVATEVGGLPEMVEHGRTGLLVPPRDAAQLADAVVRLLLDSKLRRQMGMCGKEKVAAECSAELVAQQTIDVYRRASERAASARKAAFLRGASSVTSRTGDGD
jgi:glycosyltransferase involved in cell wall biosynthesis